MDNFGLLFYYSLTRYQWYMNPRRRFDKSLMKPYQINSFYGAYLENPFFNSHFLFDFDWIENKYSLRPFFISCRRIKGRTAELHCLLQRRRRRPASYLNFANLESNTKNIFKSTSNVPSLKYCLQFWQKKNWVKIVWVLPSLFCLCFLVNSKKVVSPLWTVGSQSWHWGVC